MDEKALGYIEGVLREWGTMACDSEGGCLGADEIAALTATVRQQAALLERFEKDGEQYLLGKEAGRLEMLEWAGKGWRPKLDRLLRPELWFWAKGGRSPDFSGSENCLPEALFDLLEAGSRPNGVERRYPSEEEAMADFDQARARLARKGFGA